MRRFSDKVAVVTDGASGMGAATARRRSAGIGVACGTGLLNKNDDMAARRKPFA